MTDLATTLRQLADDIESRPDDKCWEARFESDIYWFPVTPTSAVHYLARGQYLFRRKPETITRTITYPKPVSEPLNFGQQFWVTLLVGPYIFNGASTDMRWLKQGRIHLTKEAKEAHERALWGEDE